MGLLTTRAHADLQDPLGGQVTVKIRELQRDSFKIGAESWLNDLVKVSTLPLIKSQWGMWWVKEFHFMIGIHLGTQWSFVSNSR